MYVCTCRYVCMCLRVCVCVLIEGGVINRLEAKCSSECIMMVCSHWSHLTM